MQSPETRRKEPMKNSLGGNAVPYKLIYLGTCLPDYFTGYSGHTYAVSLPKVPRAGEVLKGLLHEITHTEVFPDTRSERVYDELRCSAVGLFDEIDRRTTWSKKADDLSDSYSYFGIVEGDTV
jgi:hypothetical protein